MVTLQGIAIVGKCNEPLYLCDCTKLVSMSAGGATAAAAGKDTVSSVESDPFGFLQSSDGSTANMPMRQSLEFTQQFVLHAALDALEEYVGASNVDGTMPLHKVSRNNAHVLAQRASQKAGKGRKGNAPFSNQLPSGQYLGLLVESDELTSVYGYVTATNIKFLILLQGMPSSTSSGTDTTTQDEAIHRLCQVLHKHYITYWMNPFQSLEGGGGLSSFVDDPHTTTKGSMLMGSETFDKNVRQAVQAFVQQVP